MMNMRSFSMVAAAVDSLKGICNGKGKKIEMINMRTT